MTPLQLATAAFGTAARQIAEDLARELEDSTTSDFPFSRRQYSTVRRRNMQQVMTMRNLRAASRETVQFGFEGNHPRTLEETLNGGIGVVTYPFLSMIAGAEVEIL